LVSIYEENISLFFSLKSGTHRVSTTGTVTIIQPAFHTL
jgi:hypothetical protein